MAGYDSTVGTAAVASTASATTSRVIARIGTNGTIDTSTAADFFSAASVRSAHGTDGKSLWAAGAGGIVAATFGSTAKPTQILTNNMRWLHISGAQLYASSASGTNGDQHDRNRPTDGHCDGDFAAWFFRPARKLSLWFCRFLIAMRWQEST